MGKVMTLNYPAPKSFIDNECIHYNTRFAQDLSFIGNVILNSHKNSTILNFETFGNTRLHNKVLHWVKEKLQQSIQQEINSASFVAPFLYAFTQDFSVHMFTEKDSSMYTIEGELHLYHALPTLRQIMLREAMGSRKGIH